MGLLSYIKNNNKPRPIDISNWAKFKLTDLFDCQLAKGDLQPKKLQAGDVPLVSAGFANNGIVMYIDNRGDGISEMFNGGAITVDMFGSAFYQENHFYAVSHGRVNILVPKFKMSKNIALFIVAMLNKTLANRYSFSKMCSNSKISQESIYLPIASDGTPDWGYMEQFIAEIYTHTD